MQNPKKINRNYKYELKLPQLSSQQRYNALYNHKTHTPNGKDVSLQNQFYPVTEDILVLRQLSNLIDTKIHTSTKNKETSLYQKNTDLF